MIQQVVVGGLQDVGGQVVSFILKRVCPMPLVWTEKGSCCFTVLCGTTVDMMVLDFTLEGSQTADSEVACNDLQPKLNV